MRKGIRVTAALLGILSPLFTARSAIGQCIPAFESNLPTLANLTAIKVTPPSTTAPSAAAMAAIRAPDFPITSAAAPVAIFKLAGDAAIRKPVPVRTATPEKFPGPILITVPGAGEASNLLAQDGKFILLGPSDVMVGKNSEQGIFLARFAADGTLDTTFGHGGTIRIALFAGNNLSNNSSVYAALSPSGKIVMTRSISDIFPGNNPGSRVAIIRLSHDGIPDTAFGNGGLAFKSLDNSFVTNSVAVQRDEKVLIAGEVHHEGACSNQSCARLATMLRYQDNGTLDSSFGKSGVVQSKVLWNDGITVMNSTFSALAVQDNGLIMAAGNVTTAPGASAPSKLFLSEYLPTGQINPYFGSAGMSTVSFWGNYQNFQASSLIVQDNGRIIVGGTGDFYTTNGDFSYLSDQAFVIARFTIDGDLDGTFGNGGGDVIDINPPNPSLSSARPLDTLRKLVQGPAGNFYAAGMTSGLGTTFVSSIDIASINNDGTLDRNFGKGGFFTLDTTTPTHFEIADDALATADGRLILSGTRWPNNDPDAYVMWGYSVTSNSNQTTCH